MRNYSRLDRINELLRREIADLLERMDFHMENCLVTVNEVVASPDLRHARVYMETHRHHLQTKIAKDIILKYTPVLDFIIDDSIEKGDRVLSIISEMEKQEK
jgi:ribosome-binding factor A